VIDVLVQSQNEVVLHECKRIGFKKSIRITI
jgi:hypothetical protein